MAVIRNGAIMAASCVSPATMGRSIHSVSMFIMPVPGIEIRRRSLATVSRICDAAADCQGNQSRKHQALSVGHLPLL